MFEEQWNRITLVSYLCIRSMERIMVIKNLTIEWPFIANKERHGLKNCREHKRLWLTSSTLKNKLKFFWNEPIMLNSCYVSSYQLMLSLAEVVKQIMSWGLTANKLLGRKTPRKSKCGKREARGGATGSNSSMGRITIIFVQLHDITNFIVYLM